MIEQKNYTIETMPRGATLQPRTAKPLTGPEIVSAIAWQIAELTEKEFGFEAGRRADVFAGVKEKLFQDSRLNRLNLVYPRIHWDGMIQEWIDGRFSWHVIIWPTTTQHFDIGAGGCALSEEEKRIVRFSQDFTNKPDEIRRRFNISIEAKAKLPSGEIITVELPGDTKFSEAGLPTGKSDNGVVDFGPPPIEPKITYAELEKEYAKATEAQDKGELRLASKDLVADPPSVEPTRSNEILLEPEMAVRPPAAPIAGLGRKGGRAR